ncbi:hypothetical protein RHGRI_007299 [Rhododendron griersonianum]|uniref:Epidermal patterning factor-like protein n=1 Tax=Rhododendron griersonianum TaxID=479676 RepID=A0AAV6KX64_9ERIC|nr:hypothetical protein RHGRI_007299 [Rhododendron griersonianum]
MGVTRRVQERKRVSFATVAAIAIAFLLFASGTSAFGIRQTRRLGGEVTEEGEGVAKGNNIIPSTESGDSTEQAAVTQRRLKGLGSSRPKCIAKCGSCRPCQPVRVMIPPGVSTPSEYYPVAWRCKCGNKLFMP